jgi:hypothetical protein
MTSCDVASNFRQALLLGSKGAHGVVVLFALFNVVRRFMMTVSEPVLKAPTVSALEGSI